MYGTNTEAISRMQRSNEINAQLRADPAFVAQVEHACAMYPNTIPNTEKLFELGGLPTDYMQPDSPLLLTFDEVLAWYLRLHPVVEADIAIAQKQQAADERKARAARAANVASEYRMAYAQYLLECNARKERQTAAKLRYQAKVAEAKAEYDRVMAEPAPVAPARS